MRLERSNTPIDIAAYEVGEDKFVWHLFKGAVIMFFPSLPVLAGVLDSPIYIKEFQRSSSHKYGDNSDFRTWRAVCSSRDKRYLPLNELEKHFGTYEYSVSSGMSNKSKRKAVLRESAKPGFLY